MTVDDVMPNAEVLAAIRTDIEGYEAARAQAAKSVRWRVPLFLAIVAAVVVVVAMILNSLASPFEQWRSAPHVFVYIARVYPGDFRLFLGDGAGAPDAAGFPQPAVPDDLPVHRGFSLRPEPAAGLVRQAAARVDRAVQPTIVRRCDHRPVSRLSIRTIRSATGAEGRQIRKRRLQRCRRGLRGGKSVSRHPDCRRGKPGWSAVS